MADDDPRVIRDESLRRLSVWTMAALGGGCALTGFFAAQAATGFSGSSSSTDTTSSVTTTTQTARPGAVTGPTTTVAPTNQIPVQPPLGGVRRSAGRAAGRSGGS
jgi:multidrug efflux pump subunit AcrA (membrane-fusion protein)